MDHTAGESRKAYYQYQKTPAGASIPRMDKIPRFSYIQRNANQTTDVSRGIVANQQDVIFTEWLQINCEGNVSGRVFFCGYRQYLTLFPTFYFHQPHRERRFAHVWRQYIYN